MNLHIPFLRSRTTEQIAGLRDQIIELGTHVRFLEADRPAPQPRDDAGRFVSQADITRARLSRLVSRLTPEQAQEARMRGGRRA